MHLCVASVLPPICSFCCLNLNYMIAMIRNWRSSFLNFQQKNLRIIGWILMLLVLTFVFMLVVYHPHSGHDILPACQVFLDHLLISLLQRWMVMNSTQKGTMIDSFMHFFYIVQICHFSKWSGRCPVIKPQTWLVDWLLSAVRREASEYFWMSLIQQISPSVWQAFVRLFNLRLNLN